MNSFNNDGSFMTRFLTSQKRPPVTESQIPSTSAGGGQGSDGQSRTTAFKRKIELIASGPVSSGTQKSGDSSSSIPSAATVKRTSLRESGKLSLVSRPISRPAAIKCSVFADSDSDSEDRPTESSSSGSRRKKPKSRWSQQQQPAQVEEKRVAEPSPPPQCSSWTPGLRGSTDHKIAQTYRERPVAAQRFSSPTVQLSAQAVPQSQPIYPSLLSANVEVSTGLPGPSVTEDRFAQAKLQALRVAAKLNADAFAHNKAKPKHEYDSDEDTEGGTWEHKRRAAEMESTKTPASVPVGQPGGKRHISSYLPHELHAQFGSSHSGTPAPQPTRRSDYEDMKIGASNIGFKMLSKMGWQEGKGLGQAASGITAPVDAGKQSADHAGLGATSTEPCEGDDEYTLYRKRMMLAYQYRPNPLNNPRRKYY